MPEEAAPPSRGDRKRAEIVAIAQELFFKEGYAGTSMSQIAAAVGGSKATLYNHFQSKEQLLLAVVEDVVAPRPGDFDMATMPTAFRPWLDWFGRASVRKISSYSYVSLQRLAAAEALRFPEVGRIFNDAGLAPSFRIVTPFVAQAMEKGELRRGDPQRALEQFMDLCLGWRLRRVVWNIEPPPTEAEIAADVAAAVATFMDGQAPPPTTS